MYDLITHDQVASTFPKELMCAISGGHDWDTGPNWPHKRIMSIECYSKRECMKCQQEEANPVFDREYRARHFQRRTGCA